LIELLVVIALIAVLAGVLGLALGRGNSGTALQSGQSTISAMIAGVRAEAAVSQLNAALLVNVTPSSDGFLREFRVATTADAGSTWIDTGNVSELPSGIYLVPGNAIAVANATFTGSNPAWVAGYKSSTFSGGAAGLRKIRNTDDTADISTDEYRVVVQMTPKGLSVTGSDTGTLNRIVLAPAERVSAETIDFNNAAALRGMVISRYGVSSLVNEPNAF
jgi:type II secretory pathway pseudopilin PulG